MQDEMFDSLESEVARLRRELDELKAERDALAAYMEVCRDAMMAGLGALGAVGCGESVQAAALKRALGEMPTTSLGRLKAEWQAEALAAYAMNVSESYLSTEMLCAEDVHDGLLNAAKQLRRQAAG